MYLVYIDESGTNKYDGEENYVIGAVIIHENAWNALDDGVNSLKCNYFGSSKCESVEIHMREILAQRNLFKELTFSQRLSFIHDIFTIIDAADMRIVYSVIKKKNLHKKIDLDEWSYRFLFERLCWQLRDLNKNHVVPQKGIMIIDSKSNSQDCALRNKIRSFLKEGTRYDDNEYLIEDPLFTDSSWRSLSQMIDCIVYVVNYKYRSIQKNNKLLDKTLQESYAVVEKKLIGDKKYNSKVFP